MLVGLIYTITCPACGSPNEGAMVRNVRINKNSMATIKGDVGLGFIPRRCKPCGADLPAGEVAVDRGRLAPDDIAKVNAYRAKKGWPVLGADQTPTQPPSPTGATPTKETNPK